jgi:hypothetical protein
LSQTLWCILENLNNVLLQIYKSIIPGGSFLISQHFPQNQPYGWEILRHPEDLIALLENIGFILDTTIETDMETEHHWAGLLIKDKSVF